MKDVRTALSLDESRPRGGNGVRVAILDTGIDPAHPDLTKCVNLKDSRTFLAAGGIEDKIGHGTHVAGIIAGSGEESGGEHRGIAPDAEIVALKVLDAGRGYTDRVAQAVQYAIGLDVDIINYSAGQDGWKSGGPPPWRWSSKRDIRDEAFKLAANKGVLCVVAAGNDGPNLGSVNKPGIRPELLTVGALTRDGKRLADTSSRGPVYIDRTLAPTQVERVAFEKPERNMVKPDVVAPGGDSLMRNSEVSRIMTLLRLSDGPISTRSRYGMMQGLDPWDSEASYARCGGTSQAAAAVTGLAALLLELGRAKGVDWGANQGQALAQILRKSASALEAGDRNDYGYGALIWPNIAASLEDFWQDPVLRETILRGQQISLID